MRHGERHRTHRTGWLRAAVLGANDGIVSTASLVLGVAAAGASTEAILVAGVAGLVAGAMSMAAGEYVSVSSQADTESADLARESKELAANPEQEHAELTAIYVTRGLDESLASSVATQLMQHDALAAHGRDELGISDTLAAKPVQAALASAATFAVGGEFTRLSGAAGPPVGARWWRALARVRHARHVLGRSGNGIDRCRRCSLRGRGLNAAARYGVDVLLQPTPYRAVAFKRRPRREHRRQRSIPLQERPRT
jgi:vacuolar iron transporter family protein